MEQPVPSSPPFDAGSSAHEVSARVAQSVVASNAAMERTRAIRRVTVMLVAVVGGMGGLYLIGRVPRRRQQEALAEALHNAKEQPPAVNVVKPEKGDAIAPLTLPAEAHAYYETTIFARTSGYLNRWLVDIGDKVKSGQLLAVIDTPELEEQLIEAHARVNALEADVRLADAQMEFAKITSERWDAAAPGGAVSEQERDEKKAQLANARARMDAAKAQLELGKATVKRLEFETSFQKVVAPFDGVITQRHIDVGSLITAGSTANTTPLFAIAQYDRVRVFVQVPQTAAPNIHVSMNANITAREFPGRSFTGKVDRTSGSIDPISRTLRVEVIAANLDLTLLPGMFVTVNFQIVRPEAPLIVQAGSINLRKAGPQVAVIDSDNHVHFRNVEVARDLGDTVELARGLSGDEWVALNISDEIADGDAVQPVPLATETGKLAAPSSPPRPREQSHENKTIAAADRPPKSP